MLLLGGATIHEINAVEKHFGHEGGAMGLATRARMITLILSDVLGDDLGTIGSGPTAADGTTYADAIQTLRRYASGKRSPPEGTRASSHEGHRGAYPESPKAGSAMFKPSAEPHYR